MVFWPVNGEQCSEGAILSCYNDQEAKSAVCYLQKLYSAGVSAANIGIIIPFSLQVVMDPFLRLVSIEAPFLGL